MCSEVIHNLYITITPSLPLEGMKRKIMRNLRTLEQEGLVNSKNDYQEIINAIAQVRIPLSTSCLKLGLY